MYDEFGLTGPLVLTLMWSDVAAGKPHGNYLSKGFQELSEFVNSGNHFLSLKEKTLKSTLENLMEGLKKYLTGG